MIFFKTFPDKALNFILRIEAEIIESSLKRIKTKNRKNYEFKRIKKILIIFYVVLKTFFFRDFRNALEIILF